MGAISAKTYTYARRGKTEKSGLWVSPEPSGDFTVSQTKAMRSAGY
jgi:hypothetical protein